MIVKRWWQSLTHWVNGVGVFLIASIGPLSDALPSLQPYIGPQFYKYAFIFLGVANVLIRQYRTNSAIGDVQSAPK